MQAYSNHEVVAVLESLGSAFGPCQNAYTGVEETVYELVVPTDQPQILHQALDVFREFAFKIRCAPPHALQCLEHHTVFHMPLGTGAEHLCLYCLARWRARPEVCETMKSVCPSAGHCQLVRTARQLHRMAQRMLDTCMHYLGTGTACVVRAHIRSS